MVALQIRDVPDDVRDLLAEQAKAKGQSLQAFLRQLVIDQAQRSTNLAILQSFSDRTDGMRLTEKQHAKLRARERAERDGRWS